MFEWRVACDHGWIYRPGVLGRGLRSQLPPDRWAAFERTFMGADMERNWDALFETVLLFQETAMEVAERVDLAYPQGLVQDVVEYLECIRRRK